MHAGFWCCSLKYKRLNDQLTNSYSSHAFVGQNLLLTPLTSSRFLTNFNSVCLIDLPGVSRWNGFVFNSIQFTLIIFFTAFHCLVLASFCSSKNPDLIQWAVVSKPDYTAHVSYQAFEREIENRDCGQDNTWTASIIITFSWSQSSLSLSFEMSAVAQASRNKAQFFIVSLSLFTETKLMCWGSSLAVSGGLYHMSVYLAKA